MNLHDYLEQRRLLQETETSFRTTCTRCLQPEFSCYCEHLQSFDCPLHFAILIHPIEQRRRIATGRMAHLTLHQSHLIVGQDYSHNPQVQSLLQDPQYHPVMLYPGKESANLSTMTMTERRKLLPPGKKPLVFVIDGTWSTARKMVWQSQNLKDLPRICFTPPAPSNFRVRKQPAPECYSTIEAIHHTIDLLGPAVGFETADRTHDSLLNVFKAMIDKQVQFAEAAGDRNGGLSYRRRKSA